MGMLIRKGGCAQRNMFWVNCVKVESYRPTSVVEFLVHLVKDLDSSE